jgi:hypothetical protein
VAKEWLQERRGDQLHGDERRASTQRQACLHQHHWQQWRQDVRVAVVDRMREGDGARADNAV